MKDLCEHCGIEARGLNKTVQRDGSVWCMDCAYGAHLAFKACGCKKTPEEQAQIDAVDKAMAEFCDAVRST